MAIGTNQSAQKFQIIRHMSTRARGHIKIWQ
jgi:hypothetical protein